MLPTMTDGLEGALGPLLLFLCNLRRGAYIFVYSAFTVLGKIWMSLVQS